MENKSYFVTSVYFTQVYKFIHSYSKAYCGTGPGIF